MSLEFLAAWTLAEEPDPGYTETMKSAARAGPLLAVVLILTAASAGPSWGEEAADDVRAFLSKAAESAVPPAGAPSPAKTQAHRAIVPGVTLEFYQALVVLTHAAIRILDEDDSFWQLELQPRSEFGRIKEPRYKTYGIKGTLMGYSASGMGDIVLYNDAAERKSIEEVSPHQTSMPVCLSGEEPRKPLAWYKTCMDEGTQDYAGKVFKFGYMTNNCSHFAEAILNKCGLANCRDFPRSSGLFHRKGVLAPAPVAP